MQSTSALCRAAEVAASALYVPAGQTVQSITASWREEEAPASLLYVPAGQVVHATVPNEAE